jgi:putative ABC transport system ATP-binding protein
MNVITDPLTSSKTATAEQTASNQFVNFTDSYRHTVKPATHLDKCLLQLRNVDKSFIQGETRTQALNQINLAVNQGDFIAVQGPSGSGKSTLLSVLGFMDQPDGGEYRLAGVDLKDIDVYEKQRVRNHYLGFVFQSFQLLSHLSVLENVMLPLSFRRGSDKKTMIQQAEAMLDHVQLSHRKNHYPAQLSGGQQQRVAIARALVTSPAILLADEPTGNLDSENAGNIVALLKDFNRLGQTILMVTHDPHVASVAHRQLWMRDGCLYETIGVA